MPPSEKLNEPITVMYLIDTCLSTPAGLSSGGAEKQLYLLATSLNPALFKPVVVQLSPNDNLPVVNGRKQTLELFHFPTRRFYSIHGIRQLVRLYRLVKRKRVDVIHTFFEKSEVMGWLTSRFSGIPIWVTSRRDLGFKRKEIYRRIFRLASHRCNRCIANCLAVKNQIVQQENLSEEKMEVIYNGLDFSLYQKFQQDGALKKELGIFNETPLVGMIANFNFEIKGHRYFLEAASNILRKFPNVVFLLIGDGPLRKQYEQMANELGIKEHVRFLGKRNDVPLLIANMDISVLSSTSEGLSNVILESMAAGKPVVVTNVGGSPEIVKDGINGYLVPAADSQALAKAVIELLQNPDKAKAMGDAGRKLANEKFTVEAMVRSYERLYMTLMEDVKGTPKGQ